MYVLDLFSGIGGFSIGLEAAGMHTLCFCEKDPYCQKILHKLWPGRPLIEDIKDLDGKRWRKAIDVVCGGYPCQPFSNAGQRRGHEDERHLWPEMLRVIREVGPRWVIAENVSGHLSLGFDEVATSLEAEGFTVWPFIIPACAVNAPHKRDRIWILAYSESKGAVRTPRIFCKAHGRPHHECEGKPDQSTSVSNAVNIRQQGCISKTLSGKLTFARELAGSFERWSEGWPVSSPRICGVDDGISNRTHRLRGLGNAIVPQIAAVIGEAIMKYEAQQ